MRPKTLLELAGASAMPSRLADAAVVVIDAQRDYVDGKLPLTGMPQALDAISQLLKRARSEGAPIRPAPHERFANDSGRGDSPSRRQSV